jgi:hypothetical protein
MWRTGVRTNAISPETVSDSQPQVGYSVVIQARGGGQCVESDVVLIVMVKPR